MFAIPLIFALAVEAAPFVIAAAAMSAIGGLTGSKELSSIGSLMGMANGVFSGEGLTASATDAAGWAGDFPVDPSLGGAQTVLAGGDLASEAITQAGSVNVEGIQAPAAMPPAQAVVGAPSSDPSGILAKEIARLDSGATGAFDMGQFTPQDVGLTPSSQAQPGLIDRVLNWGKENPLLVATGLKMGGEFLAKGLGRDVAGEKVDLERRALEARLAELDRTSAARRYVPSSIGMTPNPNANLYPNGYRPPLRGLVRSQLT